MLITDATSLPRLMACNGSRIMDGYAPSISFDTEAREEGNAAHYMALKAYRDGVAIRDLIDKKAPNGHFMTSDMAEHVETFLGVILNRPNTAGGMERETTIEGDGWRVNARADHIAQTPMGSEVFIDEFKYGWGIVEPEYNWTLITHAIGHLRRVTTPGPHIINLVIHQPRPRHPLGPVRTWTISYYDLMSYAEQINRTLSAPSEELRTGPHCRKCKALPICYAARAASMNAIDFSHTAFVDQIDNATLSHELDELNRASATIKNRLEAYEELAQSRIKQGQIIENYGIDVAMSNRRWKQGFDVNALRAIIGIDLTTGKACTPAEALRRGVNSDVVSALTETVPTGTKLVRIDASKRAEKLLKGK